MSRGGASTDVPDVLDVVIAGAGPAGVAAAVALARRLPSGERRILCLDRARFPREKPCGGGLTGHARAALSALGLEVRVPRVACRGGRIVYGAARADVTLEQAVDVVRREELDADLIAQARARGIAVVEGEGLESFEVDRTAGLVRVTTSTGRRLRARVLVGADGVGSRVRKSLLGPGDRPGVPLRLFKAEIAAPFDLGDRMIYDFTPMDDGLRGYVWLFPVAGGRLNVGAMHYPSRALGGAEIERLLHRALGRHGVRLEGRARGWPAWPYDPRAPVAAPHVLCIGDAAGIDALTGEGIGVGLEHALVAADTIARGLAAGDLSFTGYRAALRAAVVGRELAVDRAAASLLYAARGFSLWLSMIMSDRRVLALYAARVSGSEVLADRKGALCAALLRHVAAGPARLLRLRAARRVAAG